MKEVDTNNQKKDDNAYLYYSNLGRKAMQKPEPKGPILHTSKVLQGVYSAKIEGDTFQFGKARSVVDLKRTGKQIIAGNTNIKGDDHREVYNKHTL